MNYPEVNPNRVIASAIALFTAYWIAAIFVEPAILRDVSNSMTFGLQLFVVITWFTSARKAIRSRVDDGAWLLVLAIWFINFVALLQRSYAIAYNWVGQPDAWQQSAMPGFWAYSFGVAAAMFLISPGVRSEGVSTQSWKMLLVACILGSFIAGFLLALSIRTF